MSHKFSPLVLKNLFTQNSTRRAGKSILPAHNYRLISKYVPKRSFVDVGCMWGVNGSYSFFAEEKRAAKVVAVDIYPASEEFLKEKKRRSSAVEYVQGDINFLETTVKIGLCDVVFCSGVLYHMPDPIHTLLCLKSICREILILNTQTISEMPGIKNTAVFYPFLDAKQRKMWNRGIGRQRSITGPYEPESGYGNWFWGFSQSLVESMLKVAGFKVVERHACQFNCLFVFRPVSIKFIAESGAGQSPQDKDFLKFKH